MFGVDKSTDVLTDGRVPFFLTHGASLSLSFYWTLERVTFYNWQLQTTRHCLIQTNLRHVFNFFTIESYQIPSYRNINIICCCTYLQQPTDRPGKPTITNTETEVPWCNITLKWTAPRSNDCPIRFYTVHYRLKKVQRVEGQWTTINVTDPNLNQQELILNCSTAYEFEVKAWNALGSSGSPSKAWPIRTGGIQQQMDYAVNRTSSGLASFKVVFKCF